MTRLEKGHRNPDVQVTAKIVPKEPGLRNRKPTPAEWPVFMAFVRDQAKRISRIADHS